MSVRLREPTVEDVPLLDRWERDPAFRGEFNDFGLPPGNVAERAEKGFIDENHGTLIVETDEGTPLGTVDWRPMMYGPPPASRAWQLGISLAPEARGQGYGPEALRAVAEYLFAHTDANRVEGSCDIENIASRRALAKAGFWYEGIARGSQFRAGAYHHLMLFGRLRDDEDPPLPPTE